MYVLFLGFLFVIAMPLALGGLLALVLREVHIRHPLPLGGSITPPKQRAGSVDDSDVIQKMSNSDDIMDSDDITDTETTEGQIDPKIISLSEIAAEQPVIPKVSVFEDAANIPENVPVNEILNSMVTETPSELSNDFEHIIESTAQTRSGIHVINEDMDAADLEALAMALPREKIDFSKELESDTETTDAISSMAKEVLGEDFNFEGLEQAKQSPFLQPDSDDSNINAANTGDAASENWTDVVLDVQENETGMVQVASPFIFNDAPQLADFIVPETILPTFSNDWIQETGSTYEPIEDDLSQFFFMEESRPMFVRKKVSQCS